MKTGSPKAKWFSGLLRNPKSLSLPPRIKYGVNCSGSPEKLGKAGFLLEFIPVKTGAGMTTWK